MAFKLGTMVDVCTAYNYAQFDELDLDGRSQWVGRGKDSALNYLDSNKRRFFRFKS